MQLKDSLEEMVQLWNEHNHRRPQNSFKNKNKKVKCLYQNKKPTFFHSSKDPFWYMYFVIFYYIAKNKEYFVFHEYRTKLLDSCAFFLLNTQQRPQRKHWNLPEFSEVTNNMQTAEFILFE